MKYPIKRSKAVKTTNHANLGMTLESDIDVTNRYYLDNNIAVVHKKPTPVQVVNVSYPARNKAKITEAYYKTPSTTDYNGIYLGKYLDFDVKETNSKTSFPLRNIHEHQVEHLRNIDKHGGIAFIIVHWKQHNIYHLTPIKLILSYWDKQKDGRKSIPYEDFNRDAYEIKLSYHPRLDYLKVVKEVYFT